VRRGTIEVCQEHAKSKNGKCLDIVYINNRTKMLWECEKGHQWKANWSEVSFHNTWCPTCNSCVRTSIEILQAYAIARGGKLKSTNYTNNKAKMEWECSSGHSWFSCWHVVNSDNTWCPYCCGNVKSDISECCNYAKSRNGKCLDSVYINNNTKMLWECKEGHQWHAIWHAIKDQRQWCPECASFKTEYKCKELLEQKLNIKFIKTNFKYNKHRYQWDGYNEEHKIAFEYHGYQHYIFPNFFQKTEEQHLKAKQRDMDKVIYAKENNIKLIIIPYTEEKNLESYISDISDIIGR
jgi:hypothetical protein